MSRKVKWGVLGGAGIARKQWVPGLLDASNAVFYAIGSRNLDKAKDFAAEFGGVKAYGSYEEVLADPEVEAVYIPLPNHLHKEWTIKALRAEKHVLCEKPMALTVAECDGMLKTVKEEQMLFMEGFMYRFHPQISKTLEWIKGGRIGDVRLIRGSFSFPLDNEQDIRLNAEAGGGSLMDVGCYPIHFSNLVYGKPPQSVMAQGHYKDGGKLDLSMVGILNYDHGQQAVFDCSFAMEDRQWVEIMGSEGTIIIPKPWRPDRAEVSIFVRNGNITEEIAFPVSNPYQLEIEHFSSCIIDGTTPLMPGEMGKDVVAVIQACHQSARERSEIQVANTN